MKECCNNCEFMHRLKHNFEQGKGFHESYACDVLMHIDDGTDGWIQEVCPQDMCEMFTHKKRVRKDTIK